MQFFQVPQFFSVHIPVAIFPRPRKFSLTDRIVYQEAERTKSLIPTPGLISFSLPHLAKKNVVLACSQPFCRSVMTSFP